MVDVEAWPGSAAEILDAIVEDSVLGTVDDPGMAILLPPSPPPPPELPPPAPAKMGHFGWRGHKNALAKRDIDPATVPSVIGVLGLAAVVGLALFCRRGHRHQRLPQEAAADSMRGIETVGNTYEDDEAVAAAPSRPCYDSELAWDGRGPSNR